MSVDLERNKMEPNPKLGDFVTACLVETITTKDYPEGLNEPRQGVFVKDNGDGTVVLQGESGQYVCKGPEDMTVVPDKNLVLGKTLEFVVEERRKLRISG